MWTGADGVALRLVTDKVDTLLTVPIDGTFQFPSVLVAGTSYVVTVANPPFGHTCVVDHAGNGISGNVDIQLDVACTGPQVSIDVAGVPAGSFDASLAQQTLPGSPFVVASAITINAAPGITAQLDGTPITLGTPIPRTLDVGGTQFVVSFAAPGGLSRSFQLSVDRGKAPLTQDSFVRASDISHHGLGTAIAIDGDTMVVAAAPNLHFVGQASTDGVVYVFVRHDGVWQQQAKLDDPTAGHQSIFGHAVALSGDTLAVGSTSAVYVYTRSNGVWSAPQQVLASSFEGSASLSRGVALAGDVLVAGADLYNFDNVRVRGQAYVFRRVNDFWAQSAILESNETSPNFGAVLAMSSDLIAVGSPALESADHSEESVTMFRWVDPAWVNDGGILKTRRLLANGEIAADPNVGFGTALAVSGDTVAIGVPGERGQSTGVNGNEADLGPRATGAVYLYRHSGAAWLREAYIKASSTSTGEFGNSVSLSGDLLAVGAPTDSTAPATVAPGASSAAFEQTGAAFLFGRSGTTWSQLTYQKLAVPRTNNQFGFAVALTPDSLAIGVPLEDGSLAADADTGALYLFR